LKQIVSIIIFLFILSYQISAQWEWQNPKPTGNRIKAIYFIDSLNGIAVGVCGDILNTSDGGETWDLNNIGTCQTLNDLVFTNSQIGYVVGAEGLILKTTDAGQTWSNLPSGTNESLNSINFPNQSTGFIVGNNGIFLYSSDEGENWNSKIISNSNFNDVYFLNPQIGFASHYGRVFKTTNGGNIWFNQIIYENWYDITFINDSVGFIAGRDGRLLITSDQGDIWTTIQFATYAAFKSITFTDDEHGFLTGGNTTLKTTNGGDEWIFVPPPTPATNLETQFFFDENKGVVAGEGGRIFSTNDAGTTWHPYFEGIQEDLQKVIFINQAVGYLASFHSVFKSIDAGNTWIKKADLGANIYDMYFPSDSVGYLIRSGIIYKSTNFGEIWDSIYTFAGGGAFSIDFVDDLTGFVAGNNRMIYKTTNGGTEWVQVNQLGSFALWSIDMVDSLVGFAVGMISLTYRTTDGGDNWTLNWLYPPEVQFTSVKFYDRTLGFIVGYYGEIYKTTNAGLTWQVKNSGVITSLYDIYFMDKDTVLIVGKDGVILKSTNMGEDWIQLERRTTNSLYSVSFIDSTTGFIVGQNGTILGKNMPITSVMDDVYSSSIQAQIEMDQNFPNPFNPETKIKFRIPESGFISLKVFDILGREVATLINEDKYAGEYEIIFNATGLASGIYFYRLRAGNYFETKKMNIIK